MKDFVFVSDFDGTITNIDFDEALLNGKLKDREDELSKLWDFENITVAQFLEKVYSSVNCSENELKDEILKIKVDESLNEFIRFVRKNNGEFIIVSSGSTYYINILLEHFKIDAVQVISNNAIFENRGLKLIFDEKSYYFSKEFGIDKKKVVETLRKDYKKVFYAGDGRSDLNAALSSDLVFSKGELRRLLCKMEVENIEFSNYKEIKNILEQKLTLK